MNTQYITSIKKLIFSVTNSYRKKHVWNFLHKNNLIGRINPPKILYKFLNSCTVVFPRWLRRNCHYQKFTCRFVQTSVISSTSIPSSLLFFFFSYFLQPFSFSLSLLTSSQSLFPFFFSCRLSLFPCYPSFSITVTISISVSRVTFVLSTILVGRSVVFTS